MTQPTVTLCLIVRDGGEGLARCLDAALPWVDEMVVVDTGSSDGSVEVALSRGARVLETPWTDDFAAARNVGLEAATSDWILILDADERLDVTDRRAWASRLRDATALAYFLPLRNPTNEGAATEVSLLRLFRRHEGVRFRYPVHEQVADDLAARSRQTGQRFVHATGLVIHHDGGHHEVRAALGKSERNVRLLRKAVEQYPEHPYFAYKLADELRASSPAEARQWSRSAIERGCAEAELPPYFADLLAIHAAACAEAGEVDEALALVDQHPPGEFRSSTYWFVAASLALRAGRTEEAAEWARRLTEDEPAAWLTARAELRGVRGAALRASIAEARGAWGEARTWALEARRLGAKSAQIEGCLGRCHWNRGEHALAIRTLLGAMQRWPQEEEIRLQLGVFLAVAGRRDEGRRLLGTVAHPDATQACAMLDGSTDASEESTSPWVALLRRALGPSPAVAG